ncbi:myb-like protein AA isoform X2 [Anopheles darlingi]|uniref:myb-like protein AA isoform X2 n=1 Tax=Anopheles darlingi TaxID=43151 RepID=UPI00210064A6|nr:myb-like protein AA isoform X2 [Anopheles darlingi]
MQQQQQQQPSRSNVNCDPTTNTMNRYKLYHSNSTTILSALKRETRNNGYQSMMIGGFEQLSLGDTDGVSGNGGDYFYHPHPEPSEEREEGRRGHHPDEEEEYSDDVLLRKQQQQQVQQQMQLQPRQQTESIDSIDEGVYSSSTSSSTSSSHNGVGGNGTGTIVLNLPVGLSPPNESLLMQRRLSLKSRSLGEPGAQTLPASLVLVIDGGKYQQKYHDQQQQQHQRQIVEHLNNNADEGVNLSSPDQHNEDGEDENDDDHHQSFPSIAGRDGGGGRLRSKTMEPQQYRPVSVGGTTVAATPSTTTSTVTVTQRPITTYSV